jgi:type II restriction enzyme
VTAPKWKEIVYTYVCKVAERGEYFNIRDFDAFYDDIRRQKPNNPFIAEKIRQQLQILRDHGMVEFLAPGSYRRLV